MVSNGFFKLDLDSSLIYKKTWRWNLNRNRTLVKEDRLARMKRWVAHGE
jgi:hypothetical protein